ncbi:hypothetical protein [Chryseobacterium oleae]|nr:hypothetical protein [Chryseobacterium oleae]
MKNTNLAMELLGLIKKELMAKFGDEFNLSGQCVGVFYIKKFLQKSFVVINFENNIAYQRSNQKKLMKELQTPDYKKIYTDLLNLKFPEKKNSCQAILSKDILSVQDILSINGIIFPVREKDTARLNQKHKSYNRADILEILDYQKKNRLNNKQLAAYFQISRNSVTKWKKLFF